MVLFVGDQPSTRTDPEIAFKGAACEDRLKRWLQYVTKSGTYCLINRVDDDFMELIAMALYHGDAIVALGNSASHDLRGVPHYKLPHPSGRNRQNNSPDFIHRKLEECRKYLETAKVLRDNAEEYV